MPAGSECVRGHFVKSRALRSRSTDLRDRARHQPRSDSRGVAGCPRRWGRPRWCSGSGSGEGFPQKNANTDWWYTGGILMENRMAGPNVGPCNHLNFRRNLERAKGFEPSTPTLAKYFSHFFQNLLSAIIYAKSVIWHVALYDCLRPIYPRNDQIWRQNGDKAPP